MFKAISIAGTTCLIALSPWLDNAAAETPSRMQPLHAVTAPSGFVDFCNRESHHCDGTVARPQQASMNAALWRAVASINSEINARIKSTDDMTLFGKAEHWTIAENAGDCEDYALLKKRELVAIGLPPSALLLTVALDEKQEGHAVLTLVTDSGDFVLDNRRDAILPFQAAGYQYLKRQSQLDPRRWVSLAAEAAATGASASSAP